MTERSPDNSYPAAPDPSVTAAPAFTVAEMVRATGGTLVIGDPTQSIRVGGTGGSARGPRAHRISIDSRTLRRGDVFFAIKGERFDGHCYLNESLKRGAAACFVSNLPEDLAVSSTAYGAIIRVADSKKALGDLALAYREKYGSEVRRAGISGSCGKTTVKEMTAQILRGAWPTVQSPGNFNNDIGCPLSIFRILPEHRFGVFEIGASAPNEVGRLARIVAPHAAAVTNISLEHTATFGTLDQIAAGESEILDELPPGGTAVLPRDDSYYEFLKSRVGSGRTALNFGFSPDANVSASRVSLWPGPVSFRLTHRDGSAGGRVIEERDCVLPVPGRFNVANACAAAALCLALGTSLERIAAGLAEYRPPAMRFEVLTLKNNAVLVNDSYNANPGSMRSSLESFVDAFPNRRLGAVLGDMLELGEISRREHQLLGKYLAGLPFEKILLHGPQSRFTYEGAKSHFAGEKSISYCPDRETLMREAEHLVQPGNAVLFKASRGVRLEEIVERLTEKFGAGLRV